MTALPRREAAPGPLERFLPVYDAREWLQTRVRAPAPLVYEVAAAFDLDSIFLIHSIFRLRGLLLGAGSAPARPFAGGLLDGARQLGWGVLHDEPGRLFAAGAYCQPWRGQVVFTPLDSETFAAFAEPGQVKIAWTLETEPRATNHCLLRSETRVVATSPDARDHFRRYWRWARFGIHAIRLLLFPAIRRLAEARYA